MNKSPINVSSNVSSSATGPAVTAQGRTLEHHPLDRRAVSVGSTEPIGATLGESGLTTTDIRVLAKMLNDALRQVSLLRDEVSELRRKLESETDDGGMPSVERHTGTIRVSVRTGPAAHDGASEFGSRRELGSQRDDPDERQNSFDWDAWQRDTKARIRRAFTKQALSAGAVGAGAE